MKRQHRRPHLFRNTVLLLLAVAVLATLLYRGGELIFRSTAEVAVAQDGVVSEELPVSGLLIYGETIVGAQARGRFDPLVAEGERVAGSQTLGTLTLAVTDLQRDGQTEVIAAPIAGVVSFIFDDYEYVLTASALPSLDLAAVAATLPGYQSYSVAGKYTAAGSPLCKIIDNSSTLRFFVSVPDDSFLTPPAVGDSFPLRFADGPAVTATIETLQADELHYAIIFTLEGDTDALYGTRLRDAALTVADHSGVLIETAALTEHEGRHGVWLSEDGVVRFCPLTVVRRHGETALVRGLAAGSVYIKDAYFCKEGLRLA